MGLSKRVLRLNRRRLMAVRPLLAVINPNQPFDIDAVNTRMIPEQYQRLDVRFSGPEAPGTLVSHANNRYLWVI